MRGDAGDLATVAASLGAEDLLAHAAVRIGAHVVNVNHVLVELFTIHL